MKTAPQTALALLLFTAPALLAQTPCSKLEVKGTGKAGTSLEILYSGGAPRSLAWLAAGPQSGSTSIDIGPLGTLKLGLATPFVLLPVGRTDTSGNLSLKVMVPKGATTATELYAQMITSKLTISREPVKLSLEFCTSNVVKVSVGGT